MAKLNLKLLTFDLEQALSGDPVVTRGGLEVTQLKSFDTSGGVVLVGVVGDTLHSWYESGTFLLEGRGTSDYDLFMKPKTRIINGFEVPAPIDKPLVDGTVFYFADPTHSSFYGKTTWYSAWFEELMFKRGNVFFTKADAIANAKAMLGLN